VLFTTPALLGHVHPMAPLARAMVARGHDVVWAIPAGGVGHVERMGIRAVATAPALPMQPAEIRSRYPELKALPVEEVPEFMFGKLFGAIAAPAMLSGLLPLALRWRPQLIVSDAAELAGHIVAAELGVPSITKGFGPILPARRVAAAGQEVAPLWQSRGLEAPEFAGCYRNLYLDIYPPGLQPQAVPHIPHRQLLRPDPEDAGLEHGPSLPLPSARPDAPLVYVTMGTVFNDPAPIKRVLAALSELAVRVLVTVGPDADPSALGSQPSHVRVEQYVPQTAVIRNCDLVVSHAGSGTVLSTLKQGLPQLCLPQGADQFLNASAVTASGAGLALAPNEATAESIRDAVTRLLHDSGFGTAATRLSGEIAAMPSPDEVAAVLETYIAA
jgi:UDP:flavonoid glycosyltransferase YjiC (YdhE family)